MIQTSIIIPSHKIEQNRNNLVSLVDSIKNYCSDEQEVIVVLNNPQMMWLFGLNPNDASGIVSGTDILVRNMMGNRGFSVACNMGAKLANGEYLFFVNHDLKITRKVNIFKKIIKAVERFERISKKRVGLYGVEGATQNEDGNRIEMFQRFENGQFDKVLEVDEVSGFLFGMAKGFFEAIEGFDENLAPCFYEEMDFAMKIRKWNAEYPEYQMTNILIPDIPYQHSFGVSALDPHKNKLVWCDEIGEVKAETFWKINRRNRKYIMKKWGIDID